MIFDILIFIIILSVLVLIHEAGHFFVAKYLGIKVEEFGYGIPPRAWGKKIGETLYSINWLPIGGFVKLYGEDEAGGGRIAAERKEQRAKSGDESRAFYARSVRQRAAVVVAGVVMNALLAFIIYYFFLGFSGFKTELPLLSDHKFFGVNQENTYQVLVQNVAKNSPAEKAGLTDNSRILTLNGRTVSGNSEDNLSFFASTIAKNKGKEVTLSWEDIKTGEKHTAEIMPRTNPPKGEGALGIAFGFAHMAHLSYDTPMQRIFSGVTHPANLMVYNLDLMIKFTGLSIQSHSVEPISQGVSGPVGILRLVSTIGHISDIQSRFIQYLNLAGILSISLAFFNILPIPALDGGRLFFILAEGVMRRKINQKFEGYIHSIGMAVLIGLILLVTFKDIAQIFH